MKVFLIIWACVQSSYLPLQDSCFQTTNKEVWYNTIEDCRKDFYRITSSVTYNKDVYFSMFCTTKSIETI